MTRSSIRASLFSLFVALAPTIAHAATPPAPSSAPQEETPAVGAAHLKSLANQAMIEMHYADALALYVHARELTPDDSTVLYSIGRAHEFLGEFPEALDALEKFASEAPADAKTRVGNIESLLTELRARVATITLTCNVQGAIVALRDRRQGATPLAPFRSNAGAATIEVTLDGFFPEKRDVVLPGGGALAIEFTLRKRSTSGVLAITTEPLGAQVFVDGQPVGTSTPRVEVVVEAGEHRVIAQRAGYDDAVTPLVVAPGASREVSLTMEPSVPLTHKWWFWTSVGVVVAGGVVLTAALLTDRHAESGTLPPGQIAAPLRF